jgi:hypothetical protein
VHSRNAGESHTTGRPEPYATGWLASLRDFSPFAFASPALEQKYQDYQSDHVGSHVAIMCWLVGGLWGAVLIQASQLSINYPRAWVFYIPIVFCMSIGLFSTFSPAMLRKHWQACSLAINVMQMLFLDEGYSFTLMIRTGSGRPQDGTLLHMEFSRSGSSIFFALGLPLSLPAWGLVQMVLFATPNFSLAGTRQDGWGAQCLPVPSLLWTALHSTCVSYLGPQAHMPESAWCRVRVVFWRIQMEVMGAVVGVLRDVAWRRFFLKGHTHLIGQAGAARAAAWPFGSRRTAMTCVSLAVGLFGLDVMAVDFWVSAIARSVR